MQRSSFAAQLAIVLTLSAALAAGPVPARAASSDVKIAIVTNLGTIDVVLDPVHAPGTVKNFLYYVDHKFFNGGTFFRAIPGFVIQGGNKTKEKPSDPGIPLEDDTKTGLHNIDGAISMARTSDPNSATTEFFICDGAQPNLDGAAGKSGYAAFGYVTKNMELVRKIARMPAESEMLLTPVKIISISRIH